MSSTHNKKGDSKMAIIRKTPSEVMNEHNKQTGLKPKLRDIAKKGKLDVLTLPLYDEIDYGGEVIGIVNSCDIAENPDYIRLVVTLYYDAEGKTFQFLYNIKNKSADFLHRFANMFAEYKLSFNLYTIIGQTFVGMIKRNQGYLNIIGIKSISRADFNNQLEYIKSSQDDDEVDEESLEDFAGLEEQEKEGE